MNNAPQPHRAFIALGANLGNRESTLHEALARLNKTPGIHVVRTSTFFETAPVGGPSNQEKYINAAALLKTSLSPLELLTALLAIELDLGRVRTAGERNTPRTLDLDLLLYDAAILNEPGLQIPHPRLHERHFVLLPLSEIAGDVLHPILEKSIRELLVALTP